jgi:uncharacterized protein (DUF2147 family)
MKNGIRVFAVMILVTLFVGAVQAQDLTPAQKSAVGTWLSSEGGRYDLYVQDGKLFGKMVQPPSKLNNLGGVCKKCNGNLKNAPLVGFPLITNLVPDGDGWSGGKIVDPSTGMVLSVKIKVTGNSLDLHAFIGNPLLGGSQTWTRAS